MSLFGSETTSTPTMPGFVKGGMKDAYKDLKKWYKKGGTNSWTLPTFANFSPDTEAAFGGLTSLAGNNSGGEGMGGHLQGIMDNGGFNQGQMDSMSSMRDLTNNKFMNSLIDGNGLTDDQKLVADRYRTGMGEEFGTSEAYNRVKQNALDQQRMSLEGQASKMGRFGGGASQSILAREQGNLNAGMDVNELDKWRTRTDKSAGDLANISAAGVSQHGGAVDRKSGLESTLFNMNQTGLGNMGQAYQTAQQPYLTQRAVGLEKENQAQKLINDEMRMHAEQDPYARITKYLAALNGAPQGTTQTTDPSLMQLLTGGGLGVLGLGSMLGGWGGGGSSQAAAGAGGW